MFCNIEIGKTTQEKKSEEEEEEEEKNATHICIAFNIQSINVHSLSCVVFVPISIDKCQCIPEQSQRMQ